MKTTLLLSILFLPFLFHAHAQELIGHFDPIVFIATFELDTQYEEGVFVMPPYSIRTFTDTIHGMTQPVAFTLVQSDSSKHGWVLNLDFDAQWQRSPSLSRVYGFKKVKGNGIGAFQRLIKWTTTILQKRLGPLEKKNDNDFCWPWQNNKNYIFTLIRNHIAKKDSTIIALRLARG